MVHVESERITPMAVPLMVIVGREAMPPGGAADESLLIEAEALAPAASATCLRVRNGRPTVTDGPYAETKEMVAGFYVIEARDLNEAIAIAARLPGGKLGVVEVRPCRDLEIDGIPHKASSKPR